MRMRILIPKLIFLFQIAFISLSLYQSYGDESHENKNETQINPFHSSENSNWRLFGGVGTGFGSISSSDYSQSPFGSEFLLSGLVSYQIPKWVFDAGASWLYSSVNGRTSQDLPITIRTRVGMVDLSPRYRITDRWQLGPVMNIAFGTDTSFSPSIGSSVASSFIGLKGVYEFPSDSFPIRLWSQLSTDFTISDRRVILGMVGIQIGIPFSNSEKSQTIAQSKPQDDDNLTIQLDPQKVFFSTNSATVRANVKDILEAVGAYLSQANAKWEGLEITGHADQRGRYDYNMNLSKKRANSVQSALLKGGASRSKLKTNAYSFLKPLDPSNNRKAWAQNRRVELIFHKVEDPEILIEKLKPLMSETPWDVKKGNS